MTTTEDDLSTLDTSFGGTAASIGASSTVASSLEEDNYHGDGSSHDQLPSVEEYKASIAGTKPSINPEKAHTASDEENPHDQLPTPEEYKATIAASPAMKTPVSSNSKLCRNVFIVFGVIAVLCMAILPPVLIKRADERENDRSDNVGSSSGEDNATIGPRLTEVVGYLVNRGISSRVELETFGTPQYNAVAWIADLDASNLELSDDSVDSSLDPFVHRYVMAVFFYALGGQKWTHKMNFLRSTHVCQWNQDFLTTSGSIVRLGVFGCDVSTKAITKLALPLNNLKGKIPSEVRYLKDLEILQLQFNPELGGELPDALAQLTKLQDLQLQYCGLEGKIPSWIGSLVNLKSLGLSNNAFVGEIPSSLGTMYNLELLGLDDNALEADLQLFENLYKIESLYLEDNIISGSLTDELLSGWPNLVELDLSDNNIHSQLPQGLFQHESLQILDLHGNQFYGPIPEVTSPNAVMRFLSLHENELSSPIPASIANLTLLAHLDLSRNKLSSFLPSEMSMMTKLRYLFTSQNKFSKQTFPEWMTLLTNLRELGLKNNNLFGELPKSVAALNRLQLLDLDSNELNGQIPEELGLISGLDHLLLNRNKFSGSIPDSFATLWDLDVLLLDGNDILDNTNKLCNIVNETHIKHLVADCAGSSPEVTCSCCDICCVDNDLNCNNYDWFGSLDPIWEYGYTRAVYAFSQQTVETPPQEQQNPDGESGTGGEVP